MEKIEEEKKTNKHTQRIDTKNDKPHYGIACKKKMFHQSTNQFNSIQKSNQMNLKNNESKRTYQFVKNQN